MDGGEQSLDPWACSGVLMWGFSCQELFLGPGVCDAKVHQGVDVLARSATHFQSSALLLFP